MLDWIPWQEAAEIAAGTATAWGVTSRSRRPRVRAMRPWAKELTLILLLYGLWQYAGHYSLAHVDDAMARGRAIWDAERALHLPSEHTTQAVFLHHRLALRGFNEFYAFVHTPALFACLVWLFVRHRELYPPVRTVLAIVTGASLVIQLFFATAPPRLLPLLGVIDAGALIGPRVYTPGETGLDQLSAMPSLHVGWSIVIAVAIVWVYRRPWRWLALLYPIVTEVAVVVTGNHFWADGIVAAALCAPAIPLVARAYARPQRGPSTPDEGPRGALPSMAREWGKGAGPQASRIAARPPSARQRAADVLRLATDTPGKPLSRQENTGAAAGGPGRQEDTTWTSRLSVLASSEESSGDRWPPPATASPSARAIPMTTTLQVPPQRRWRRSAPPSIVRKSSSWLFPG